jgi:hypothetical protein
MLRLPTKKQLKELEKKQNVEYNTTKLNTRFNEDREIEYRNEDGTWTTKYSQAHASRGIQDMKWMIAHNLINHIPRMKSVSV